jgi:hypothetical protein
VLGDRKTWGAKAGVGYPRHAWHHWHVAA